MRQVGYLQRLYTDARSTEHKLEDRAQYRMQVKLYCNYNTQYTDIRHIEDGVI